MSSEEEKYQSKGGKAQTLIRMRSPSPGPQFMKDEVYWIK
jgi:hypothetical protein